MYKNGLRKEVREVNGRTPTHSASPKKPIDWTVVKKLCMMQCTTAEICAFLEISKATMYDACLEMFNKPPATKFDEWREGGNCSLRRKQWNIAETNASMAIFLGKQYLNQSDDYNYNHKATSVQIVHFGDNEPQPYSNEPEIAVGEESEVEDETSPNNLTGEHCGR